MDNEYYNYEETMEMLNKYEMDDNKNNIQLAKNSVKKIYDIEELFIEYENGCDCNGNYTSLNNDKLLECIKEIIYRKENL